MNMISVVSSNLVSVGYDEISNVLRIQFKSGTYDYYNVPVSLYIGLLDAPSKGRYHDKNRVCQINCVSYFYQHENTAF